VKVHNDYTREASFGRGVDRHLMGLRLVMKEGESSPLFDDELYGLSQEWLLSTSGLSAGDRFIGTGYVMPLTLCATTDNPIALEARI
jgi:carnitine O-acetyltransferase